MSATPRTDEQEINLDEEVSQVYREGRLRTITKYVPAEFARQLERELTMSNAAVCYLKKKLSE